MRQGGACRLERKAMKHTVKEIQRSAELVHQMFGWQKEAEMLRAYAALLEQQPVAWGDVAREEGGYLTTDQFKAEGYSRNCYPLTPLYALPAAPKNE